MVITSKSEKSTNYFPGLYYAWNWVDSPLQQVGRGEKLR